MTGVIKDYKMPLVYNNRWVQQAWLKKAVDLFDVLFDNDIVLGFDCNAI